MRSKKAYLFIVFILFFICFLGLAIKIFIIPTNTSKVRKLYWFIPDGFRADHHEFNIYEWARHNELPNLKKMMDKGCYGFSWPVFPGHTPTNFATLMTGVNPLTHGVVDGSIHLQGYPLNISSKGGFSSFAKLVPAIWLQLENAGRIVSLQSIPGSTPPELFTGNVIKGRWGGWGIDLPAEMFHSFDDKQFKKEISHSENTNIKQVEFTHFIKKEQMKKWDRSFNRNFYEIDLSNENIQLYAAVDARNQSLLLSVDRKNILGKVSAGVWSDWIPIKYHYELENNPKKDSSSLNDISVQTYIKIKPLTLSKDNFRIRIIYDGLNSTMTSPESLATDMQLNVGHMVDFVDNTPPQLVYSQQDKATFIEEANFSWDWHRRAVSYLINNLKSDVIIHSIYTPNQMLTSRWWLPFIDKTSMKYDQKNESERAELWGEVKAMYKKADDVLGEIMRETALRQNEEWYIVLSSDHGVVPLYREVRLNNLFRQKGWLTYKLNPKTSALEIDWKKTKVVYLQMNNIYINPQNLSGAYNHAHGEDYEKLRDQVIAVLENLQDPSTKQRPLFKLWKYEEAPSAGMRQDRVGDLVISNSAQYLWSEDMTTDGQLFSETKKGGYKQGVWPQSVEGMLTPFVVFGPNIKAGCTLEEDIHHVDQFATIESILGIKAPYAVEGNILKSIFK